MRSVSHPSGRGVCAALVLVVALCSGVFPLRGAALAQDYEAMMPNTLRQEVKKAHDAYRQTISEVHVVQTERLALAAKGAAEADLRALDAKVGQLVTEAEHFKVQADYLEELYAAKMKEYKSQ